MENRNYLHRLLFIIKKLRSSKVATFDEINDYIKREFELKDGAKDISIRTLQRDLNDIRDLFCIDIKCNSSKQYYIAEDIDDEYSNHNRRMLEAFDIHNLLNTCGQISTHVLFEDRCKLGTQHLFGLLHAINNNFAIKLTHQSHYQSTPTNREVEPYALKEFKGFWYLLAKDYKDKAMKTFGLDRILDIEITKKKFIWPANFSAITYFKNCYGVTVPNNSNFEPEEVILLFTTEQGKYLKSYPLHESQNVLSEDENEIQISLYLFITFELKMQLLSYGDSVEIIKPKSLIEELKEVYKSALNQY